jgi:hypothetical protein
MTSAEVLVDAFGRVRDSVAAAVDGLTPEELAFRPDDRANSIAWLVWHLTRVQDDHVAAVAGTEQVWNEEDWFGRFALGFEASATGYGHGPDEVAAVRVDSGDLLLGYYDAVHHRSLDFLARLRDVDLDRIVDRRWDPPVTLGVRLVSVLADDLEHAGQAAYLRGLVERR